MAVVALAAACNHTRQFTGRPEDARVGPVPVVELARVVEEELRWERPFVITVRPLRQPAGGGRVVCKWTPDGSFESMVVGGPARQLVEIDWSRQEGAVSFDRDSPPRLGGENSTSHSGWAHSTAFLCAEGNQVALLLDSVGGPLSGRGRLLILRAAGGGRWELVVVMATWNA
jgi:hypothetical protein